VNNSLTEYYEFIINVPDESREALTHKITGMGSSGSFERNGNVIAYFPCTEDIRRLCAELDLFPHVLSASGLNSSFSYDYSLLTGRDWNEEWKKNFRPIDVGDNLTIVPSWITPDTERVPLIVDPGMAFGTGHHETTKRCLMLIEELSYQGRKQSLLDVGTGTGILAIGASRTGFAPVTALDTDQTAVDAACHNAGLNGIKDMVIKKGSITEADGPYDVIVANLLSEILIDISQDIQDRLNPGGTAILSGMIKGQENGVIKAFENKGMVLKEKAEDDKWITLTVSAKEQ
jgi:ribosomal protein L11 methyltransferase